MSLARLRRFFGIANSPGMSAEAGNPFRMRTSEKCARKSFAIRTYKNTGLKPSWNQHLQKTPGEGVTPFFLLPFTFPLRGAQCPQNSK